ncbi:MAG: histidine kinase [Cytophagales bacterium]
MFYFFDTPPLIAIINGLFYNGTFATIALGLWYTIRFMNLENQPVYNLLLNHLGLAFFTIVIWLGFCEFFIQILFENIYFNHFSEISLPFKIGLGVMYYLSMILYYYLNLYYSSYREKQFNEIQLQALLRESELNKLRSQLNPHFMFNSLNSISSLTLIEPYKAQEMIVKLSSFMRNSLQSHEKQIITLEKELENTLLYLEIEKVRFGDRLIFNISAPEDLLKIHVPAMLLQPLVENSIKHGVYTSTEPITIDFVAHKEGNYLIIVIRNNFYDGVTSKTGTGSGLKNTKERLKLIYKNNALIHTQISDNFFKVTIQIPCDGHIK